MRSSRFLLGAALLVPLVALVTACDDDGMEPSGGAGNGAVAGRSGSDGSGGSGVSNGAGSGGGDNPGEGGNSAGEAAAGGVAGTGPASTCGDGTIEAGECEPPSTSTCSDDCVAVVSEECVACEQAGACFEFSESCLAFEGEERALCYDTHACVYDTGCAEGDRTLTSCFCGELSTGDCITAPSEGAGAPSGACAETFRLGLGGPEATNSQVLTRYLNSEYPAGAALARMNCVKLNLECSTACRF